MAQIGWQVLVASSHRFIKNGLKNAPDFYAQPVEYKSLSLNILLKNIPMNQGPFFTKGLSVTSLCPPHTHNQAAVSLYLKCHPS